ncbi:MAG: hypothetical protein JWO62_1428 [Acidimicrobiaceae bacterium]|nr:hypothetical protein [Acidimicrobiaceae bacterium]
MTGTSLGHWRQAWRVGKSHPREQISPRHFTSGNEGTGPRSTRAQPGRDLPHGATVAGADQHLTSRRRPKLRQEALGKIWTNIATNRSWSSAWRHTWEFWSGHRVAQLRSFPILGFPGINQD